MNSTPIMQLYEMRAESLLAVDEMIGGLVDELTRQGIMENTWATPKLLPPFRQAEVQKVFAAGTSSTPAITAVRSQRNETASPRPAPGRP